MMCCILKDSFFSLFFGRSKLQHHHWSNKCRTSHTWCNQSNKHEEENVDNNCIKTKKKICFDFDYSIFVLFLVIKFKKRDMMVMMKFDDHWMVSTTTMKIHGRENTKVVVVVVVVVIIVFVVFIHCLLSSLMCRIFSFSLFIFLMIIIFF